MNVTFVACVEEFLGLEYISAVLKQHGHSTTLVFDPVLFADTYVNSPILKRMFDLTDKVVTRILDTTPDLVAFSVMTEHYPWASRIAQSLKQRSTVPILFGGPHPTLLPERVISKPFVDFACVGEGEYPTLELVRWLGSGRTTPLPIPNMLIKHGNTIHRGPVRELLSDLDALPISDKALFYDQVPVMARQYTVIIGRGCPFGCTFCCNNAFRQIYRGKGKYLRWRTVDNVMTELKAAKQTYRFRKVAFFDDVFTFDKEWIKQFLSRYRAEVKVPFTCIVHPRMIDETIVEMLADAGCKGIQMGVQTVNEKSRKTVVGRPETNNEIGRSIRMIRDAGICVTVDHILGIPREGAQEQEEAIEFYNTYRPHLINLFWLAHYPATKMLEIAQKTGELTPEDVEKIEEGQTGSIIWSGTVRNREPFKPYVAVLNLLPFLPQSFVRWLARGKRYWMLRWIPNLLQVVVPRFYSSLFLNDLRSRNHWVRMIYLSYYFIKFKFGLLPKPATQKSTTSRNRPSAVSF